LASPQTGHLVLAAAPGSLVDTLRLLLLALLLAASPRVERVDVDLGGVRHTKANAVRRLMTTRDGAPLDEETLRRDVARLRSTGILYDVEERTIAGPDGARVELSLKDRWTLLPLFGLRRAGGRPAHLPVRPPAARAPIRDPIRGDRPLLGHRWSDALARPLLAVVALAGGGAAAGRGAGDLAGPRRASGPHRGAALDAARHPGR